MTLSAIAHGVFLLAAAGIVFQAWHDYSKGGDLYKLVLGWIFFIVCLVYALAGLVIYLVAL